ncbi:MAG: gamma-glutamyltransferase family protein [Planctomycetes bacterium]|jgi:gamma-glutamyltranspeptidase/glutathione hydrolase|nr:gamma-glutamyltransferase family protein [Planctomycetota bacterium]
MELSWSFPYPSRRMPVLARNVVATSQPLAAQAGLRMMTEGGNAADAALAAAIALVVVEPVACGVGGDAFALVWDGTRLRGLNGSGRSPAAWTPERFAGRKVVPAQGWDAVTVPGQVAAWATLSAELGRLPFPRLFQPAIRYAREGYPVSPKTAQRWAAAEKAYKGFSDFAAAFLPGGRAPRAGEAFRCPDLARTLEILAETKGEDLYRGGLARKIAACSKAAGGAMTEDDLAAHETLRVEPLSMGYRGVRLHEIPPNGQGIAALIALGILGTRPPGEFPPDSADALHLELEAMKLALADAYAFVADPDHMRVDPRGLLDGGYLESRARTIRMDRAQKPACGLPPAGGTVTLAAADEGGMMVSWIQSNFQGFGSGIVVPGTGISLQNRGIGFTLEPGHPNRVAGRKRPFHTIIPGFVTRDGSPLAAFGLMGGNMQAQGHVQMVRRMFEQGLNPQAASDAPRWYLHEDFKVAVEPGFGPGVVEELRRRGHEVEVDPSELRFGGAQIVLKTESGYCAASDHRKDGQAAGF